MNDQATTRLAEVRARFAAREDARRAQERAAGRAAPNTVRQVDADMEHLLSLVEQLQGQLSERNDLIRDLHDPEPCRFDHHGYCQDHGWFETDPPCPDARAQALVQALGVPGDR